MSQSSRSPLVASDLSSPHRARRRVGLTRGTFGALLLASIAGCSAAAVTDGETASESSALTATTSVSFGTGAISMIFLRQDIRSSTLTIANNTVTFVPGTDLWAEMKQANPAATMPAPIVIPSSAFSVDGYNVALSGLQATVDLTASDVELVGSNVVLTLAATNVSAQLAINGGLISVHPTLTATSLNVSLALGFSNAGLGFFFVNNPNVLTIVGGAANGCGIFDFCDSTLDSMIAGAQASLNQAAVTALNGVLNPQPYLGPSLNPVYPQSEATQAFEGLALEQCALFAPAAPPQGAGAWGLNYVSGLVQLSIGNSEVTCGLERDVNPAPEILAVSPSTAAIGDTVIISAQDLNSLGGSSTKLTFGGIPALNINCDMGTSGNCFATVPPGSGTVDVQATTSTGLTTALTSLDKFTYAPIAVTSILPSQGPLSGGTDFTFNGTGLTMFQSGGVPIMQVRVGNVSVPYACWSSTSCYATTPPGAALGDYPVTVVINGKSSTITGADWFDYQPDPAIASLSTAGAVGTVVLGDPAPAGGATVALSTSPAGYYSVPATVVVPAGSTTGTFALTRDIAANSASVTLTAAYKGQDETAAVAYMCEPTTAKPMATSTWSTTTCTWNRVTIITGGGCKGTTCT